MPKRHFARPKFEEQRLSKRGSRFELEGHERDSEPIISGRFNEGYLEPRCLGGLAFSPEDSNPRPTIDFIASRVD